MHLINHSLKKSAAIAAAGALMFSLFVSGGMVMAAPPSTPVILTPSHTASTSPVTIEGTAEPNVRVQINGFHGSQSATTTASGIWSFSVPLQSNEPNNITISAFNEVGEESGFASVTITHDNIGPLEPTVTSPTSPHSTTTNPIMVSGTAGSNSTGQVVINGGATQSTATADASGNWTATVQLNPDSTNTLTIVTFDEVGNQAGATLVVTHTTGTSTPDVTPPLPPFVVSPTSPHSTTTSPITVTGMAEGGSTVSVTGGSANATTTASGVGNFTVVVSLNTGSVNTLLVRSTDAAGNVSAPDTLIVTHSGTTTGTTTDTTAPNAPVVIFPISPYTTASNAVLMTGTAEAGSTVRVANGTTTAGTTTASVAGNWSVLVQLPTGTTTTFMVTATDAAGNTSSSTMVVITQTTSGTGTTSTSSPIITLIGDAAASAFICNLTSAGYIDPGATAVTSSGATTTVNVSGSVSSTTTGTFILTYTATDDGFTATTTRTVTILPCSSGGGGGGSSSGGSSSGDNANTSGDETIPPFIGVTPPGGGVTQFFGVSGIPGTTQVLGASFVPGLPSTGGGEEAFKFFLPILLSFGVVLLGLSLGRKKESYFS